MVTETNDSGSLWTDTEPGAVTDAERAIAEGRAVSHDAMRL